MEPPYPRLAPTRVLSSGMIDSNILRPTKQMGLSISLRIDCGDSAAFLFLIALIAVVARVSFPAE
jgi:hypothetical protein